ncbi:MAG: hypothetical protein ACP5RF_01600 [Candidatus Micrarchaeia archaeon]
MAKKNKKEGGEEAKKLVYVKVSGLEDIVRYASKFDSNSRGLLNLNVDGSDRIVAIGESIDDSAIAYYINFKPREKIIRYDFGSDGDKITFTDSVDQNRLNSQYIEIIALDMLPFKTAKTVKKEALAQIKVKESNDLIKSIIRKAVENEEIGCAYVFNYKGKAYIAAFDVLEGLEDTIKTFYYAELHNYKNEGFARYDYSKNVIDFSNGFGEHTYLYVKLIRLAEHFPFFDA